MDYFHNIWNYILDFFTHVSLGSVLTYIGTGATLCFGIDRWLLSHRKPKASLFFTNGKKEITFSPHYYRAVSHKYYVDPPTNCYASHAYKVLLEQYNKKHENDNEFILSFRLENTGKLLLENYRVEIECEKGIGTFFSTNLYELRKEGILVGDILFEGVKINNSTKPQIVFLPVNKHPLNQKDEQKYTLMFTPNPDIEVENVELCWRIIAKDFFGKGKFTIHLKPYFTEYDEIHFANCDRDIPEGAEKIEDLTPYIQQLQELLKSE